MDDEKNFCSENQINKIIDFAKKRFFRYGYSSVTIDEIATEMCISKTTFYRFFKSKEELLHKVIQAYWDSVVAGFVIKEIMDVKVYIDELKSILGSIMEALRQLDPRARDDMHSNEPSVWKNFLDLQHRSVSFILSNFLRSGIKYGVIRPDIKPDFIGDLLAIAIESIVFNDLPSCTRIGRMEALQSLLDIVCTGLLASREMSFL